MDRNTRHLLKLVIGKIQVAPIQTVSLPRLELSGAVLLANLVHYVLESLNFSDSEVYLWTDSSIVLSWLSKPPSSWETYVANRIAQIHRLIPNARWQHVPKNDNPPNFGTPGCKPQDLIRNSLWWRGPTWLTKPSSEWPKRNPLKIPQISNKVQTLQTEV